MPKIALKAGAELDILSQRELDDSLDKANARVELSRLYGVKWMRLPEVLSGVASGSVLTLGETSGEMVGPDSGYAWAIRRLVVNGLTAGATPDVVNLYRGTAAGIPLWQFTGTSAFATFGKLSLTLMGGERLALASVGTFAATGTITLAGELIQVPAQLLGKLA